MENVIFGNVIFPVLKHQNIPTAYGNAIVATKPPFVRSRYSLRWRKTTTATAIPQSTTGRGMEVTASTQHPNPKLGTSTASPDYDYYGNGEADNLVHK